MLINLKATRFFSKEPEFLAPSLSTFFYIVTLKLFVPYFNAENVEGGLKLKLQRDLYQIWGMNTFSNFQINFVSKVHTTEEFIFK